MGSRSSHPAGRAGGVCAFAGSALLVTGTCLHPMHADPNDAIAAFTEYAADHWWVASHLLQLAGVTLIVAALLVVAHATARSAWSRVAGGGAVATLAVATVLQAADGVALKAMVDAWAAAAPRQKDSLFHATLAVRQVEIGLASTLSMLFGLTVLAYAAALRDSDSYPKWLSVLALPGGAAMLVSGVVTAFTGFSAAAMAINMPATSVLLVWIIATGLWMWRFGRSAP